MRIPAWTDRILYRSAAADLLTPLLYTSASSICSSDHKPVMAIFSGQFRCIDEAALDRFYEEALRRMDHFENDSLAVTRVSVNQIDFKELVYRRPSAVHHLVLANEGPVVASFKIHCGSQQDRCRVSVAADLYKHWLRVHPLAGILLPGQSLQIHLVACPDAKASSLFNEERASPEEILVVHVDHGSDHFVSIEGTFRKSVFARSLLELPQGHAVQFPASVHR